MPVSAPAIAIELVGGPRCGDHVIADPSVIGLGQVEVDGDLYRMETDELDNEHRASYVGSS